MGWVRGEGQGRVIKGSLDGEVRCKVRYGTVKGKGKGRGIERNWAWRTRAEQQRKRRRSAAPRKAKQSPEKGEKGEHPRLQRMAEQQHH